MVELGVFGSLNSIEEIALKFFKIKLFFFENILMHVDPFNPLIWFKQTMNNN